MIKLKRVLASRYTFKILFIVSLVYLFLYINYYEYKSIYNNNDNIFTGIVTNYKYNNNKYTITIRNKESLIVNYMTNEELNIQYGDTIKVVGTLIVPSNNTIPNLFNYRKYLERKHIYYIVKASNINIIKNNNNIIYDIKNIITRRIKSIKKSSSYIEAFVLGNKNNIDKDIITSYSINGVSHLFAISGMHISLFSGLLYFLLKKISYNNYYNFIIVLSFLIFYMIILDYPISVVRTILMFSLFKINKLFHLNINKLDIMLLIFIIIIISNPYYIFDISFQFSYIISFYLVVFKKYIDKKKYKKLYMSYLCFIVSFPIVIYNYYQVSIISIIINMIFIPWVSIVIFPLSILTLIFPILDNILYINITILENISLYISNIDIFKIVFSKPSIYILIIYYLVITLSIYNLKYNYVLILILLIHNNFRYIDNRFIVSYLDVGQGDSILIIYRNKTVLIDTGGNYYYKDLSLRGVIPYLKSLGRNKIDYLIITHGDYDHVGEGINIVNNIKVDNVIFNNDNYNKNELSLIEVLNNKNIKYYNKINSVYIYDIPLFILNTRIYDNENDNSIVIYMNVYNKKLLFMGDAEESKELDLINKYNLKDIDILKVGHHGSKTSSSIKFIDKVNPKYSIISVGKNNRYGHPNSKTLDNLNKSKIYRTDKDGSIIFKFINNKFKIITYVP